MFFDELVDVLEMNMFEWNLFGVLSCATMVSISDDICDIEISALNLFEENFFELRCRQSAILSCE